MCQGQNDSLQFSYPLLCDACVLSSYCLLFFLYRLLYALQIMAEVCTLPKMCRVNSHEKKQCINTKSIVIVVVFHKVTKCNFNMSTPIFVFYKLSSWNKHIMSAK